MITKQLKNLLMIPSPNASRSRPRALPPEAAAHARVAKPGAARAEASAPEASAPPAPGEPPAPRPTGDPAPRRAPAVPSFLRAAPADPASLVPPGMRKFTDLRGTQPTSDAASTAPVLPFGLPAPPQPAKLGAAMAEVPRGMRGFTSLTGTQPTSGAPAEAALPFSSSARAAPAAPAAPAASPGAPPAPALSLEQYASLCADLAAAPAGAEALFAQYGLREPEARRAVDGFWRERLARDPAAHQRWQELYWQQRARSSPAGKSPNEPR
ncbi:hypothetical protein WMF28_11925 [Sorangium sp. So ce590]|uniref:hypothetical protein n=1 Tax=Sorangium sp. So ce590 TaxID=3133317 RepID=UPI003F623A10